LLLHRWGGARGLEPLLTNLPQAETFDAALRTTYHVTEGDFERRWQKDVASRYGWLSWAAAMGFFWLAIGAVLGALVMLRRRRNQARRAALDEAQLLDELEIKE
jgi:cell division protein FtsX